MTPERVKAIAEAAWIQPHYRPLNVAIERAIRQAVNEALEEAAKACCFSANPYGERDPGIYYAAAIRALKLPEEP